LVILPSFYEDVQVNPIELWDAVQLIVSMLPVGPLPLSNSPALGRWRHKSIEQRGQPPSRRGILLAFLAVCRSGRARASSAGTDMI
jgi:hypothetical protein